MSVTNDPPVEEESTPLTTNLDCKRRRAALQSNPGFHRRPRHAFHVPRFVKQPAGSTSTLANEIQSVTTTGSKGTSTTQSLKTNLAEHSNPPVTPCASGSCEDKFYEAMYTHQKTKKAKTWQDGFVKYIASNKSLKLYDESRTLLTSFRFVGDFISQAGEELDIGRYLVIVDENAFVKRESTGNDGVKKVVKRIKRVGRVQRTTTMIDKPCDTSGNPRHTSNLPGKLSDSNEAIGNAGGPHSSTSAGISGKRQANQRSLIRKPMPTELTFGKSNSGTDQASGYTRTLEAPTSFMSYPLYQSIFSGLLMEHLQVLVNEFQSTFHKVHQMYQGKPGRWEQFAKHCLRHHIGYYAGVNITRSEFGRTRKDVIQLQLPTKEHHSKYGKDDLWIVAKDPIFYKTRDCFLAHSTFYGPSTNKVVELKLVAARDVALVRQWLEHSPNVVEDLYAIRAFNAGSEWTMVDTLTIDHSELPIMNRLLRHNGDPPSISSMIQTVRAGLAKTNTSATNPLLNDNPEFRISDMDITTTEGLTAWLNTQIPVYNLNENQRDVIVHALCRILAIPPPTTSEPSDPTLGSVTLIHGPFGTGKSFLIGVLIIILQRLQRILVETCPDHPAGQWQVLVTSMTNVAVDRVLTSLLGLDFTDFVRVGNVQRINKRILPYTVRASMASDPNEDIKELEKMLNDPELHVEEAEWLSQTIDNFRSQEQRSRLHQTFVMGTTCLAATLDVLSDCEFPIVILDEASQVPEPLSFIPISRFKCQHLVLVGDPHQLPPTLATKSMATPGNAQCARGLDRTLFDRLSQLGYSPLLLRTQYRCHPSIAQVCNDLFYQNQLVHGVLSGQRAPLVPGGFGPLCFVPTEGQETQRAHSKSYYNPQELTLILRFLAAFLPCVNSLVTVGVIALYKEQATKLTMAIERLPLTKAQRAAVKISTVDAFQGSEKDVILLSCVRSKSLGFIQNTQRINVALSRARHHLVIFGHPMLLLKNAMWHKILREHCGGTWERRAEGMTSQGITLHPDQFTSLLAHWNTQGGPAIVGSVNSGEQAPESITQAVLEYEPTPPDDNITEDGSDDSKNNSDTEGHRVESKDGPFDPRPWYCADSVIDGETLNDVEGTLLDPGRPILEDPACPPTHGTIDVADLVGDDEDLKYLEMDHF